MFAGGYWGNTGQGGQVTYIPLGPLQSEENETNLYLRDEQTLTLQDEASPLVLADEKAVVIEDDNETDLTV